MNKLSEDDISSLLSQPSERPKPLRKVKNQADELYHNDEVARQVEMIRYLINQQRNVPTYTEHIQP